MRKFNIYDRRVVHRYVESGQLKREDVENHLKNLPDETSRATWIEIEVGEAEGSGSLNAKDMGH